MVFLGQPKMIRAGAYGLRPHDDAFYFASTPAS